MIKFKLNTAITLLCCITTISAFGSNYGNSGGGGYSQSSLSGSGFGGGSINSERFHGSSGGGGGGIGVGEGSGFSFSDGQFDISGTRSGSGSGGKISAAVQTKHTFETRTVEVPFEGDVEPQIIEIEGGNLPLELHFKSASGRIRVKQSHELSGSGQVEHSEAEEEPMRLVHHVRKPIIQEVREIITPFRKVIQEIQPVQEEIHTIVSKGESRRSGSNGPNKGGDFGGNRGGSNGNSGLGNEFSGGDFSRGAGFVSSGGFSSNGGSGGGGGSFGDSVGVGGTKTRY